MAAALALASTGHQVDLYEMKPFLGGRASSFPRHQGDASSPLIDNCQHILMRCCHNLLDFYRRLGVADEIDFAKQFYFLEAGGQMSTLQRGLLPAPLHFAESFLGLKFLSFSEKMALGRAMLAVKMQASRTDLDTMTMAEWLAGQHQPPRVIERFWRQVLVSAVNEELEVMSAAQAFQVMRLGFLDRADAYEMGVPLVPLGDLYTSAAWTGLPNVRFHLRHPVSGIHIEGDRVARVTADAQSLAADFYISALPFDRLSQLLPQLSVDWPSFAHSPITGVHLWFDRPVTNLPHGTLVDSPIHWFFASDQGRHLKLVVSASRDLISQTREQVRDLSLAEMKKYLPQAKEATLVDFQVIKEVKATIKAVPGLAGKRPGPRTQFDNLMLAGDWTNTGWPSTMEGAARSGYLAADHVNQASGKPQRFFRPDQ